MTRFQRFVLFVQTVGTGSDKDLIVFLAIWSAFLAAIIVALCYVPTVAE